MAARNGESLRVDATGTIHPVGRVASQQLRSRAGEFELLPCPGEVIIARAVGMQGSLKMCGEIRTPGALCDVVSLAAQSQWVGELVVIAEVGRRSFFFERGLVISALTTVPDERLGEMLYRFGVLTREQLEDVVRVTMSSPKRLGEVAIELGHVTAEQLYPMMARQAEEVFYAALHVSNGAYYFFDRFDESQIVRRHNLNAGALLMEGARRMDEMSYFREKVPGEDWIPVPLPSAKKPGDDVAPILAKVDGRRTVAEIGRIMGLLEFEVTRAVFQLVNAGHVQMLAPCLSGPEAIVEAINPGLVEIHSRCDALGKGAEIRDGLARFATGAGVYDTLFMSAGPASDGSLRPEGVSRNIVSLAGVDPDAWLAQLLSDYISFALFQAESLLPRETQALLHAHVAEILKPVRPLLDAPPSRALG
jgi:hypothetical protein